MDASIYGCMYMYAMHITYMQLQCMYTYVYMCMHTVCTYVCVCLYGYSNVHIIYTIIYIVFQANVKSFKRFCQTVRDGKLELVKEYLEAGYDVNQCLKVKVK